VTVDACLAMRGRNRRSDPFGSASAGETRRWDRRDEKCGRLKGQDAPVRCVDNVAKTMARVLEVVKWRDKKIGADWPRMFQLQLLVTLTSTNKISTS
jgi:hypothetical protein